MTKNAVIYARYSSDRQREESIEGQLRECKAFADANGYEIIGTYIDRALSARTDQRPEFLRMISDSDRRLFQFVIVYSLDRFSRSRYDSAIYKNRLKKNGVRVLSAVFFRQRKISGMIRPALFLNPCLKAMRSIILWSSHRKSKEAWSIICWRKSGSARQFLSATEKEPTPGCMSMNRKEMLSSIFFRCMPQSEPYPAQSHLHGNAPLGRRGL